MDDDTKMILGLFLTLLIVALAGIYWSSATYVACIEAGHSAAECRR